MTPHRITPDQLIDDSGIKGGSPVDRVIGMLLERTEAVRELHEKMRQELHDLRETHIDIKNMMGRMSERQEQHEKRDAESFGAVNASDSAIMAKLDALSASITNTTTAALVQKAQFNAGWKVIVVIGGIATAAFAIFAIFFNHTWK